MQLVRPLRMSAPSKAVLNAIADNADDAGHSFASLTFLAEYTCLCQRAVQNAIKSLESANIIRRERENGRETAYFVNHTLAPDATVGGKTLAPRARVKEKTLACGATVEASDPSTTCHPGTTCHGAPDATGNDRTLAPSTTVEHETLAPHATVEVKPLHHVPGSIENAPIAFDSAFSLVTEEKIKTKEQKKKKAAPANISIPDWVPSTEWHAFLQMRVKIRKPATEHAQALLIAKLDSLRQAGESPVDVLNNSIVGSWQDLYAPKRDGQAARKSGVHIGKQDYSAGWGK